MYHHISGEDPYKQPMRIYPAVHYTMGGLWVDYSLMSNLEGLFVLGEANFSDHGANRLGASALMQGLADGYFVVPYTLANYLGGEKLEKVTTDHDAFRDAEAAVDERVAKLLSVKGGKSVKEYHRSLGRIMWDHVGMARNRAGLQGALQEVTALRAEYQQNVRVVGPGDNMNKQLEYALRVDDYMEFADIMVRDALDREESCGCHFREEYQTEDGECLRNDANFAYVAAWEFKGRDQTPELHKEQLEFKSIELKQRSYK
jgi:succinate dehydrogenase / fumarate reductase, flavoprotein subunit